MDAREVEMAVLVVLVAVLTAAVVALANLHFSGAEALLSAATGVIGAALVRLLFLVRQTNNTNPTEK